MTWYTAKYKSIKPAFRGGETNHNKINATKKYVEYFLDIQEMNALLVVTKSFDVKMDLLFCLDKAESKKQWNFRHPNFDRTDANTILQAVRNVKKHNDALDLLEKY
jgi:hypothetical protein